MIIKGKEVTIVSRGAISIFTNAKKKHLVVSHVNGIIPSNISMSAKDYINLYKCMTDHIHKCDFPSNTEIGKEIHKFINKKSQAKGGNNGNN